jgi:acyl-CoA synthetase (AMP-forming)/AMP-acid ligase II
VYCAEVESALFKHDSVAECVVFAVPDERLGEEVGAAVYLRQDCDHSPAAAADALREHCRGLLSSYKVPRYLWILDEPLPRNANGKFLKRALQDSLALADAA